MAEPGRTVRVSGLPTDIEDDRLKDKLFIHFLRARNGGGEIDSVIIVKATPVAALVTFEDGGVAHRVIQHRRHILEVDGKKYKLTATEHRESLDPEQVIVSLSATVDYSRLPGGVAALASLRKSHCDVLINYTAAEGFCTLYGAYTKVQAALAQLLGHPGGPQSTENQDSGQPAIGGSRSAQAAPTPRTQESEDRSRKPDKKDQRERNPTGTQRPSDEYNSSSNRDLTPGGYDWDDTGQTDGAALQLPPTSTEDFSLIVDADMFQYLQKHCQEEYQDVLSQHGVDVVDVTNQGLTTLYLQVATTVTGSSRERESLKMAKKAISRLYEENETKIRRAQLPKLILSPRGGLQTAMETLSLRLPKLLLNEDDQNIYIIGSSGDVSEAKQFLLLDQVKVRDKKEDATSLLRFPSYDSSTPADEEGVPLAMSSTVGSVDDRIDQMLRSEEDEKSAEGPIRYKLAARFKNSGLAALGSRATDFTLRTNSSPSKQTRLGPVLGHDILSEAAGSPGEAVSRAVPQNTGGDILFTSGNALPSTSSTQKKTFLSPDLIDARPKTSTSPFSTTQSSLFGGASLPPAGSGPTLKRASSFSGTAQLKAQVTAQRSQDDSSKSAVGARRRSSSFSTQTGRDKQEAHNAEFTVSLGMWNYILEAYGTQVEDLTSDVQMKQSNSEGSNDLIITLRGANSSKVSSCQLALQKLVDSVSSDFSVQKLCLSELGVANTADETLQACCSEVRSCFKKVSIQILKNSLYLLGPKQMCSQVSATLREVFSGDPAQPPKHHRFSNPSTSTWNSPTSLQINEDQSSGLDCHSNSQVTLESQSGKADATSYGQEWKTTYSGDFGEKEIVNAPTGQPPVRKAHVVKEKVKIAGTGEMDGQKTESFVNHSATGNDTSAKRVNGVGSTTACTDEETTAQTTQIDSKGQRAAEIQNNPEDSRSGQGGPGCICVCGETGQSITRTKCGAAMCSKCLDTVHAHCRVCHETAATPRGIQGKISKSKLHINLAGHSKVGAIKITYRIPDGIQGDGHPSPGKPFQGDTFEAFLPDSEKTRKLLPRLEKAFRQGLTFTVTGKDTEARVTWDCIPHKTSLQGGKSGKGYPDSSYLMRLSEVLTSYGIAEEPAKSQQ
ncbi:uncharacterized protein [Embiotoca jacksoni]|uniref:uncharacterized protein n=1 Tax=Embiotoca jacksoni TaxID=100190 RepID=UPI00370384D5